MGRLRRIGGGRWQAAGIGLVVLVVVGALIAALGTTSGSDDAASPVNGTAVGESAAGNPGLAADQAGGGGRSAVAPATGSSEKQIEPVPPTGQPGTVVPGSPRVVRTGEMQVKVPKDGFQAAYDRVATIAAIHGGFVSDSSTAVTESGRAGADRARSGTLTVRVPAERFDAARRDLATLGEVESQSLRGEDVSGQLVDYEARLKSLRAQEDALQTLLGKATGVGDVLQVQSALFDVRQQIEQIDAQRSNLDQAASLATLLVSVYEPGAGFITQPVERETGLAHSVERAVDGAEAVVGGMIVAVGWAIPVAVLAGLLWGVSRLFRRRPPTPTPAPAPAQP